MTDPSTDRQALGDVLGNRYRVVSRLGSGAFGEVYEAEDSVLARRVAIKRIRLEALADETQLGEVTARFLREAQVAAQLKHPNIVTIHDVVSTPTLSFIVMELIEGVTLQAVLQKKKRLSLSETIEILTQAADALDHAHQHKVVHRDVKPANIMIEGSGRVKVTDFGIAKAESSGNLTATGSILGTPNYMSPEQAQGKPLDGRSDLFSLGCIAYECLAGAKPFHGDSVTAILLRILNEEPHPIDHDKTGLSPLADDVLGRALAKDPARRYSTGASLVQALRSIPSVDPLGPTMDVGATGVIPSSSPRTYRHKDSDSTMTASSTAAGEKADAPVTTRRSSPAQKTGGSRWWAALVAAVLFAVLAGSWWWTHRRLPRDSMPPTGRETTADTRAPQEPSSLEPEAEAEDASPAEAAEVRLQPTEEPLSRDEPASPTESPKPPSPQKADGSSSSEPPRTSSTVRANERATVERLLRLSQMEAQAKEKTGRYATAQEISRARRLGMRLRGDQWVAQGYRFVLKVPKPDFYLIVAVPVVYGESGIHSFYIDPQSGLRGGDKKGAPASASDPVLRQQNQ